MFGAPNQTPYDLHFSVVGIPVRVHPLFWLMAVVLGFAPGQPALIAIWVGVVFISILVHEMGHALAMRHYGFSPSVVLYMGGGLAMYHGESSPWQNYAVFRQQSVHPWHKIIISAAGPAAGFLLAAIVCIYLYVGGRSMSLLGVPLGRGPELEASYLAVLVFDLLVVNVFWGLVNLLPVYPLDGGQIARELFVLSPRDAIRTSLFLSIATAIGVAVLGYGYLHQQFLGIMFAYFAIMNYQMLQGFFGGGGRPW